MKQYPNFRNLSIVTALVLTCAAGVAQVDQTPVAPTSRTQVPQTQTPAAPVPVQVDTRSGQTPADPSGGAPATLTFQDALKLARQNNPTYRSAVTDSGSAHEDKVQSRAALLPNMNFNSQAIYTQPLTGALPTDPRFIASNGVHEYIAQGNVHEALSLEGLGGFRHAQAAEAVARA